MKKIIAAAMSICIVGGSLPAVYSGAPECVITASAANYEEITDGVLHYRVYADHAELISSVEKVEGEINIPSIVNEVTVTGIADYAFYECINLTSIKIPDSVTSIGEKAFKGCKNLESITIPDTIISIGREAFCNCIGLTSMTIPDSVTNIGESVFEYCEKLKSITIPDSVKEIGGNAFELCQLEAKRFLFLT